MAEIICSATLAAVVALFFTLTGDQINRPMIIYTKPGCPYCAKAREFYTSEGVAFEERNAQDNQTFRAEMLAITEGDPTVPVIVKAGRLLQIGWEGRG